MFETLPQGIKISISRSINTAFEKYMSSINWDEDKYKYENFIRFWNDYSKKHASWYHKVDDNVKSNKTFQQELIEKINETIEKIITTPPTDEQMSEIERLVKENNIPDVDYCCKAEAKYHIDRLQDLKKKIVRK